MHTSYRILATAFFLIAGTAFADGSHFSASDLPFGLGIKKQGRIVIRNDEQSITAYGFFGNVSKALVSLRTSRSLRYASFGNSVYDSSAQVNAALPVYLANAIGDAGVLLLQLEAGVGDEVELPVLRLALVRRVVRRRGRVPPARSERGISALTSSLTKRVSSASRNLAIRSSSRRMLLASWAVSRSPTSVANASRRV